eukprot:Pgem_evm1s18273
MLFSNKIECSSGGKEELAKKERKLRRQYNDLVKRVIKQANNDTRKKDSEKIKSVRSELSHIQSSLTLLGYLGSNDNLPEYLYVTWED